MARIPILAFKSQLMDIKEKVGIALREVREKKRISQQELAVRSTVDRTFISHIEKGRRNVSIETLAKLLDGMNMSFKDFFKQKLFVENTPAS